MSEEKITVKISKKGMVIDAEGFKGKKCLDELAKLKKFLAAGGIDTKEKEQKLKPEINSTESVGGEQIVRR